jgi:prepilin-type N-terminal cleavage/methylation domain-containing protein
MYTFINLYLTKEDSMHQKRGFTLIELLVVIAIIAILATVVLSNLTGLRVKARNASTKSDVTEAGKTIEVYKNDDQSSERVIGVTAAGVSITSTATAGGVVPFSSSTAVYAAGTATNRYAIKIEKTPGTGYTYKYTTVTIPATTYDMVTGSYTFCGNIVAGGGDVVGIYSVTDGSSTTGAAAACP